jgi:hypothetical protein
MKHCSSHKDLIAEMIEWPSSPGVAVVLDEAEERLGTSVEKWTEDQCREVWLKAMAAKDKQQQLNEKKGK